MEPVKNRRRAKAVERRLTKLIGGERVSILGKEDIRFDKFAIEVKSRKTFVAEKWFQQAEKNAQARSKVPLLIVHITRKRHNNDLVVLRLKDFMKILKEKK